MRNYFSPHGETALSLLIWIPVLVVLGVCALGLMFGFVFACDKV
jgi:hypothetical protein